MPDHNLTREQLHAKLKNFSISDINNIGVSSQETNMQLATVGLNLEPNTSSATSSSVLMAMQSGLQQSQQFIANAEQRVVETDLLIQRQQKERAEIKQKADRAMQKMQQAKRNRAKAARIASTLQAVQDGVRLVDSVISYSRANTSTTTQLALPKESVMKTPKPSLIQAKVTTTLAKKVRHIQDVLLIEHGIKASQEEIEQTIIRRSTIACAPLAVVASQQLMAGILASTTGVAIVQYFVDNNANKPTILVTPNPRDVDNDALVLKPQEHPKPRPFVLPGFSIHSNNQPNIFITPAQQAIIWSLQKKSGKTTNDKHVNQDRREVARKRHEEARENLRQIKNKINKTPADKIAEKKAERAMNKARRDMNFTGETHGRRSKKP